MCVCNFVNVNNTCMCLHMHCTHTHVYTCRSMCILSGVGRFSAVDGQTPCWQWTAFTFFCPWYLSWEAASHLAPLILTLLIYTHPHIHIPYAHPHTHIHSPSPIHTYTHSKGFSETHTFAVSVLSQNKFSVIHQVSAFCTL